LGETGSNPVKKIKKTIETWRQDPRLGSIIRNFSYLFSSNGIAMGLAAVQSVFAARLLGVYSFGVIGAVTKFGSNLRQLFSFRMDEMVVKYMGDALEDNDHDRAAAVVKAAALLEFTGSFIAFAILVLIAPLGAKIFIKDETFANLIRVYGVFILTHGFYDTSIGVLQVLDRFRSQAVVNLIQSIVTASIILGAFIFKGDIFVVLLAYLLGKVILGIGPLILAVRNLGQELGKSWWRVSLTKVPDWKAILRFAFSTNLSATINLFARDSETLWISYFLSPLEAGYYKVAMALMNYIAFPITPLIKTTYPEINRTVAKKNWKQLRHLLGRVTLISGGWSGLATIAVVFFGNFLLLIYGAEYLPAYPALVVLVAGYAVASTLYWNRPLMFAFGDPVYPFKVMAVVGIAKIGLAFWLVPQYGFVAEAALLSVYQALSVGIIAWRGIFSFKKASLEEQAKSMEMTA
jgi:O-antigen/teichoic acid export membrane protein